MEFKDKLKELRLKNNLTRKQLADLLEVSNRTIEGYEQGIREPKKQVVEKMAKIFNIEPIELIVTLNKYTSLGSYLADKKTGVEIALVNYFSNLPKLFFDELIQMLLSLNNKFIKITDQTTDEEKLLNEDAILIRSELFSMFSILDALLNANLEKEERNKLNNSLINLARELTESVSKLIHDENEYYSKLWISNEDPEDN